MLGCALLCPAALLPAVTEGHVEQRVGHGLHKPTPFNCLPLPPPVPSPHTQGADANTTASPTAPSAEQSLRDASRNAYSASALYGFQGEYPGLESYQRSDYAGYASLKCAHLTLVTGFRTKPGGAACISMFLLDAISISPPLALPRAIAI